MLSKLIGFRSSAVVANLGDANQMYYNEELRRWVQPGDEDRIREEMEQLNKPPPEVCDDFVPPTISQDTSSLTTRYPTPSIASTKPKDKNTNYSNRDVNLMLPNNNWNKHQKSNFFVPSSSRINQKLAENKESTHLNQIEFCKSSSMKDNDLITLSNDDNSNQNRFNRKSSEDSIEQKLDTELDNRFNKLIQNSDIVEHDINGKKYSNRTHLNNNLKELESLEFRKHKYIPKDLDSRNKKIIDRNNSLDLNNLEDDLHLQKFNLNDISDKKKNSNNHEKLIEETPDKKKIDYMLNVESRKDNRSEDKTKNFQINSNNPNKLNLKNQLNLNFDYSHSCPYSANDHPHISPNCSLDYLEKIKSIPNPQNEILTKDKNSGDKDDQRYSKLAKNQINSDSFQFEENDNKAAFLDMDNKVDKNIDNKYAEKNGFSVNEFIIKKYERSSNGIDLSSDKMKDDVEAKIKKYSNTATISNSNTKSSDHIKKHNLENGNLFNSNEYAISSPNFYISDIMQNDYLKRNPSDDKKNLTFDLSKSRKEKSFQSNNTPLSFCKKFNVKIPEQIKKDDLSNLENTINRNSDDSEKSSVKEIDFEYGQHQSINNNPRVEKIIESLDDVTSVVSKNFETSIHDNNSKFNQNSNKKIGSMCNYMGNRDNHVIQGNQTPNLSNLQKKVTNSVNPKIPQKNDELEYSKPYKKQDFDELYHKIDHTPSNSYFRNKNKQNDADSDINPPILPTSLHYFSSNICKRNPQECDNENLTDNANHTYSNSIKNYGGIRKQRISSINSAVSMSPATGIYTLRGINSDYASQPKILSNKELYRNKLKSTDFYASNGLSKSATQYEQFEYENVNPSFQISKSLNQIHKTLQIDLTDKNNWIKNLEFGQDLDLDVIVDCVDKLEKLTEIDNDHNIKNYISDLQKSDCQKIQKFLSGSVIEHINKIISDKNPINRFLNSKKIKALQESIVNLQNENKRLEECIINSNKQVEFLLDQINKRDKLLVDFISFIETNSEYK